MNHFKHCCVILFILNAIRTSPSLHVQPVISIRDLNEGHSVIGKSIRLECKSTLNASLVSIKWFMDHGPLNPDFVTESSGTADHITVSTLSIPNVQSSRRFHHCACQAVHQEWPNFEFTDELLLYVYGESSHVISFKQFDVLELGVYIRAHPEISSVAWMRKENETILADFSSSLDSPPKGTNYYVKFPSEGLRDYSLTAKTEFETKTTTFSADLLNKTVINLSLNDSDGNIGTYKCETFGFSKRNITWIFKNYNVELFGTDLSDSNGTSLTGSNFEEDALKATSYVSVNLSDTGFLECHCGGVSKGLHVLFIRDGFDIFPKNTATNDNGTNIVYVKYKEPALLVCVASLFNYTDKLFWIYDDDGKMKDPDNQVKTYLAYETINVDYSGERSITCKALSRSGEVKSKTVLMVPKKISNLHPSISLEDKRRGHTIEGEFLELTCNVLYHGEVEIEWAFLSDTWQVLDSEDSIGKNLDRGDSYTYKTTSKYTTQSNLSKAGAYRCGAKTHYRTFWEEVWVPVYGTNETTIKFDTEASVFDRTNRKVRVFLNAHPEPTIEWFDNNGEVVPNSSISTEYTSKNGRNNYATTLSLPEFSGQYSVVAQNGYQNEAFPIVINLTGIPTSTVEIETTDEEKITRLIKCTSIGYPEPEIRWYFQKCTSLETCEINESGFQEMEEHHRGSQGVEIVSYISINISDPGILRCLSKNSMGENYTNTPILYVDGKFDIFAKGAIAQQSTKILETVGNEKLKIICAVSIEHFEEEIEWDYHESVTGSDTIHEYKSLFSYISELEVLWAWDLEKFTCNALTKEGVIQSREIQVKKRESSSLSIQLANKSVEVSLGASWKFECRVEGFPTPVVIWLKDNHTIQESGKVKFSSGNQELEIADIAPEDEGDYICQVSNRFRVQTAKLSLTIRRKWAWLYIAVVVLAVVVLALVATLLLYFKIRAQNPTPVELQVESSDENNLENAYLDLLSYDSKWEIPFDNIKLDEQIGSGGFGVVFKARITDNEKPVAIKTIIPDSGYEGLKNLTSELKIVSHLGKHINVVDFLGACTRNIIKKQLYLVMEYCQFGNLRDYIRKHSKRFVDQKNYTTDEFEWTKIAKSDNSGDYVNVDVDAAHYAKTSEWMSSKDLLNWGLQVSKGMEYLGSCKIVHGDLAARNVLLSDENVVKICDFCSSEKVQDTNSFVKKAKGPVPVKWMAIESIGNGIFSAQSDVWSFGVVLWEFFALGEKPYPGISLADFYQRLVDGYRMQAPKTATTSLYKIMLKCWNSNPILRPSFANLTEQIETMLDQANKNCKINDNDYVWME